MKDEQANEFESSAVETFKGNVHLTFSGYSLANARTYVWKAFEYVSNFKIRTVPDHQYLENFEKKPRPLPSLVLLCEA